MNETPKNLFESRLIHHLANQAEINNCYDTLAELVSLKTGKNVNGRTITFMSRGETYAKKWLLSALFELALQSGWMPQSLQDWENIVWTITGKKQSVLGGDNSAIYEKLADIADKPEIIFADNFNRLMNEKYNG